MNRLEDEHIHLLLDEPIYIIADHGDHPNEALVEEELVDYIGENKKGIAVFTEEANEEDLAFLFKGLNALNIDKNDVAIFSTDYNSLKDYPAHSIRLRFSEHVNMENAFKIVHSDDLSILSSIPLNEIRNNLDFKRQFWEALKIIFKSES